MIDMKRSFTLMFLACFCFSIAQGRFYLTPSFLAASDTSGHLLTVIDAPVSGGNQVICGGQPVPTLSVSVKDGETADWYNSNNELVAYGTTTYYRTYPTAGSIAIYRFYVEARNIV